MGRERIQVLWSTALLELGRHQVNLTERNSPNRQNDCNHKFNGTFAVGWTFSLGWLGKGSEKKNTSRYPLQNSKQFLEGENLGRGLIERAR